MRVRADVSAEKLRGGFYSPESLVRVCFDRAAELLGDRTELHVLEPSAGDGAFIHGLARHGMSSRVARVTAVELVPAEAAKSQAALSDARIAGNVVEGSFLEWVLDAGKYDVAVGNPPFVRFQFVSPEDQALLPTLAERLGVSFAGVSNLWIPILLGSLAALREGGTFAFIVPAECFTGVSARTVRLWLAENAEALAIDMFPAGSFPSVLQEVVVLSGRRLLSRARRPQLEVREHFTDGRVVAWSHALKDEPTWTRHLLEPEQVAALDSAGTVPAVQRLGTTARFEVAAVTGANDYFCVDVQTAGAYSLAPWLLRLLPRMRHAPGLVYNDADQGRTEESGAKAFLLDFSADRPDPSAKLGASLYLGLGTATGIDKRYKTRIRDPWYRVPHIKAGQLMLSKRSHRFPRVVLNEAAVVTTDTIYRGSMQPGFAGRERDLAAAFHNSLTLLTAEVEGRSFGGGVLELVPSEIARLMVPFPTGFGAYLDELDVRARTSGLATGGEELVDLTDALLARANIGLTRGDLATLREARSALVRRRLDRN